MSIENSFGPTGGISEDDFVENPQFGEGQPPFIHFDDVILLENEEETEQVVAIIYKSRPSRPAATFSSHSATALEDNEAKTS